MRDNNPTRPAKVQVLVLSSDRGLIDAVESSLSGAGYAVQGLEAADGPQALRLGRDWLNSGQQVDLLLIDVRLAGEPDGIALGPVLADTHGPLVIYMTPDSAASLQGRVDTSEPWRYVVFPFSEHYLRSVLALARRSRSDAEREFLGAAFDSIQDGIVACDADGVLTVFNSTTAAWHDLPTEPIPPEQWATNYNLHHPGSDEPMPTDDIPLYRALHGESVRNVEVDIVTRDGDRRTVLTNGEAFYNAEGKKLGAVVSMHDITERKLVENELRALATRMNFAATHDDITDLGNRRALNSRLQSLLSDARNTGRTHSLCLLDLDQFKIVNETCGHEAGDALLRQIAGELISVAREQDLAVRLSGDDFVLILTDCGTAEGISTAERLRAAISGLRFEWRGQSFAVTASVGVVPVTATSGTVTDVLVAADAACSLAKESGRNQVQLYRQNDANLTRRRDEMAWVVEVNKALEEERFVLYRQPIVSLNGDTREQHQELLLRMHDSNGMVIAPGNFLIAAERYDLMPQLDRWVVQTVLNELARLKRDMPADTFERQITSINLSGMSLGSKSLQDLIQRRLHEEAIPAHMLCFEITETAAIRNLQQAITFMQSLRKLGCRFALDDFGSGLSSYGYLQRLPFDYLKIDGNFVRSLADQHLSRLVVESINHVAHGLNIKTIAEWVEDERTISELRTLGVDYGQGYALGRPEPLRTAS